jgi:curli production assembly/transport component CsgG
MKKTLLTLTLITMLSGCAVIQSSGLTETDPTLTTQRQGVKKEFDTLPPPNGKKVTAAVYSFADKTGQRKPTPGIASLSSAVTQGAEVFLIKALQDVGRGEWFDVVERVGIDSLTKERTIIRQMREAYEGLGAKPLMPLQFAGIIMEGGIIGYDSSSESGGAAYRFLGIGPQTQYSKDTVTISLRAVSVNTGKVLAAVSVTKIVYSTSDSVAVLKFIENKNLMGLIIVGETTGTLPKTLSKFAALENEKISLFLESASRWIPKIAYAMVTAIILYNMLAGGFLDGPKIEDIP